MESCRPVPSPLLQGQEFQPALCWMDDNRFLVDLNNGLVLTLLLEIQHVDSYSHTTPQYNTIVLLKTIIGQGHEVRILLKKSERCALVCAAGYFTNLFSTFNCHKFF